MNYAEFQEQYARDAEAEFRHYIRLSPEGLLAEAREGRFGSNYQLWRAIAQRVSLRDAAPVLLGILRGDGEYLVRYHAAVALIALLELVDVTPVQLTTAGRVPQINAVEALVRSRST